MRVGILLAAVVAAVLIIVVIQYGGEWFGESAEPAPVSGVEAPPPADVVVPPPEPVRALAPEEPEIVLPELNASDAFVVERFAPFALPQTWLAREDLVRRLAVVIDNAPRGEYPRSQLGFLAPAGPFKVIRRGDVIYLDPVSYARYDGYLDAIEQVDPKFLAESIALLEPLITEGLAELGNRGDMTSQINAAIDSILQLKGLGGEVRLIQPQVLYQFADPQLEALSPLQKQALRMGPDNLARLQAYLTTFQQALAAP